MTNFPRCAASSFVVACAIALAASNVEAQTATTWTGTNNVSWATGTAWSGGVVPTASIDAVFNTGANNVNLNVSGTVNRLVFSGTQSIAGNPSSAMASGTLTIMNGVTHSANSGSTFTRIPQIVLGGNQEWSLNGPIGSPIGGTGMTIAGAGSTIAGFSLNGHTLTKTGTGQLSMGGLIVGNGSIAVNQGSLRLSGGNSQAMSVSGTGNITVAADAALFLGANGAAVTVSKAIVMSGGATDASRALLSYGNSSLSASGPQTIAASIQWNGFSELRTLISQTTANLPNWTYSGNWSGTGTVILTNSGTLEASRNSTLTLSGSNGGLQGVVDNQFSRTDRLVQFGSADAGSASAEWRLSHSNAGYMLNGFNVALGALGGSAGTLSNGAVAAATATIGGKGIDTAFGGVITNGSTGSLAITKVGSGRLTLSNTSSYTGVTSVNNGLLAVNGSIAASSGVGVASGATLGGSGAVSVISGAGLVSPGNSPGILTATSIDPSTGMDFAFELTGTGSPAYGNASNSVNDVLRLTAATPALSALTTNNVVSIYFGGSIADGDTFRGGTYVDSATTLGARDAFATAIADADWQYYVYGNGGGTHSFNGTSYYTLSEYDSSLTITRTVVADSANFGGGTINGAVTQFVVVPEPGAMALALTAVGGFMARAARQRSRRAA
jgi:autotransporter-associated beta strand protein